MFGILAADNICWIVFLWSLLFSASVACDMDKRSSSIPMFCATKLAIAIMLSPCGGDYYTTAHFLMQIYFIPLWCVKLHAKIFIYVRGYRFYPSKQTVKLHM
jgi:hypothetical protein